MESKGWKGGRESLRGRKWEERVSNGNLAGGQKEGKEKEENTGRRH